jgi:DNA-binding CsgD family transcriptional regulator
MAKTKLVSICDVMAKKRWSPREIAALSHLSVEEQAIYNEEENADKATLKALQRRSHRVLSPMQDRVFQLFSEGHEDREIAKILGLSVHNVQNHLSVAKTRMKQSIVQIPLKNKHSHRERM